MRQDALITLCAFALLPFAAFPALGRGFNWQPIPLLAASRRAGERSPKRVGVIVNPDGSRQQIDNPETPASGCGEPPIVNMGAVIANAIYDAVGARLLQLPMTPARIQEALERG